MHLHPNNINRDIAIEIPNAWMPTIRKHNSRRAVRQRTTEGTYGAHEQAVLYLFPSSVMTLDGTHFLWLLLFAIELKHAVEEDVILLQIGAVTVLPLGKV